MIDLYDFIQELNDASLPTDIINPSASGTAANIILQTWKVKKGQRFCTNFVLGEMGAGLPYSIGAALATGRRVLHIEGDGGFQLNIQELETIRRLNLPIIMFIINNNGYASIRDSQTKNFGRLTGADDTSGLTLPNLQVVSDAYGILHTWIGVEMRQVGIPITFRKMIMKPQLDLLEELRFLMNPDNKLPLIIEIFADPAQQYHHRVKSKLVDGQMTTAPMNEVT